MATAEGVHRLSKVAKELNVSVSTLVEFLNSNGGKVDSNPNAKITDSQYTLLRKEYEGEKKVKDEAKQLAVDKPFQEEIPAPKKEEAPFAKASAPVAEREKIKLEEPKVISKIDLPETPGKKGRGKKQEEEKKEEPVVIQPKAVIEEAPAAPTPSLMPKEDFMPTQINKLEGPTIIGKIDLPKPVASSAGPKDSGPKKRKRIFKKEYSREDVKTPTSQNTGTSAPRRPGSRPPEKRAELTDEEIQAQIKVVGA